MTIQIDAGELALAMESGGTEAEFYLDLQTGAVFIDFDISPGHPGYEEVQAAREDDGTRYRMVERIDSRQGWLWMEEFADGVADPRIRDRLLRAIEGRGAFGRLKDALLDYPELREAWFRFHNGRLLEFAWEWLHVEGIEAELVGGAGTPG
jgi:hypothetical protein